MEFMLKLGICKIFGYSEAKSVTGRLSISVTWVEKIKGDVISDFWIRLMVREWPHGLFRCV